MDFVSVDSQEEELTDHKRGSHLEHHKVVFADLQPKNIQRLHPRSD
jgi:hypothetical protein